MVAISKIHTIVAAIQKKERFVRDIFEDCDALCSDIDFLSFALRGLSVRDDENWRPKVPNGLQYLP
jgi:hypothetical protein